jgi:Tol biopolymer transport system component
VPLTPPSLSRIVGGATGKCCMDMRTLDRAAFVVLATLVAACTEPDVRTPSALALSSGDDQAGEVGAELPAPIVVQVTDSFGRPVPRVVVNFQVTTAPGSGFSSGSASPASAETNVGGVAQARWTLGTNAGPQTLRAWIGSSANTTISSLESQATARPGPATALRATGDQIVAVTAGDSTHIAVTGTDRYGNLTGDVGEVTWDVSDPTVARITRTEFVTPSSGPRARVATVVGLAGGRTAIDARGPSTDAQRFDLRVYVGPGRPIAFAASGYIHVLSADGSSLTRVGPEGSADPAWSPDGSRIAFTLHGTDRGLYVMNADGSGIRALATGWTITSWPPPSEPAWSADGTRIAFVAPVQYDPAWLLYPTAVFVVGADGSARQQVGALPRPNCWLSFPSSCGARRVAWSPHGTRLAFAMRENGRSVRWGVINAINPDGTGLTELLTSAATGNALEPAWSPDGTRIAFAAGQVNKPVYEAPLPTDIHVMNGDGTRLERLTRASDTGAFDSSPAWAADGRIAFVRLPCCASDAPRADLYVMNADGSEVRRVFTMTGGIARPAWRPTP